ncbi:MAG TPA: ImmA/IrrE family metallo-endopeptidase [Solirubrobacterales bacterium]
MQRIPTHVSPPGRPSASIPLDCVPALNEVPEVAREARRSWGVGPTSRLNVERICKRLEIEVAIVSLGVPDGGAQGFLLPRTDGRFLIEVDPEPRNGWPDVAPPLRASLRRHRQRFLIAHELAHTLFYEGPSGGRRLVMDSPCQELFCDELARALLIPPEVAAELPLTPEGVVEIQRRFDVSMELALRGAVAAHGDSGAAWLLLHRDEKTLIQWTSAHRSLTSRALHALRKLAARAAREGCAVAGVIAPHRRARALYLPRREQVIVTWEQCVAG